MMTILEYIKPELVIGAVLILAFFICLGNYATRVDEKRKHIRANSYWDLVKPLPSSGRGFFISK